VLAAQAVHVWRADLAEVLTLGGGQQSLATVLSSEERARAQGIAGSERRALWTAGRALLRTLLGRYAQSPPEELPIGSGIHGKPRLDSALHEPLSFNLSHSGPLALYAIARSAPLGVDVERTGRPRDHVAIARRLLGSRVADRLEGLAPSERERELLRLWTRHEAELKLHGTGFAPETGCTDPAAGPVAGAPHEQTGRATAPWIVELMLGPRTAGALAVALAPDQLCCWSWSGEPALAPARAR
jgi:4'-phosphopantetheinyl transferase